MASEELETDRPALRIVKRAEPTRDRPPPVEQFPPVVQVLNRTAPHIQDRMQDIVMIGFRRGLDTGSICRELYSFALTIDYEATIGVQEVRTDKMPSFRGRTVSSAIVLVDLRPKASFPRLLRGRSIAGG